MVARNFSGIQVHVSILTMDYKQSSKMKIILKACFSLPDFSVVAKKSEAILVSNTLIKSVSLNKFMGFFWS